MDKIRLFLLLFLTPCFVVAQQGSLIVLQSSTSLTGNKGNDIAYVKNPVFRHENTTLSCDSAVFYKARNYFEAFRNVHIVQGDTVNIYADFLTYDGNSKIAHLTSNVRMITPTSTLTTSVLDYNTGTKIGQYIDYGKIVNPDAEIVSKRGWYFANSRDAYFRYDVLVTTPQSVIKSDTLRYNTFSNWAYFYGPTDIKGKDDNLYTENGAYNTKTENAYFGKKNLYTNGSKSLKGDSLYYFGKRGYGRAVKNIVFIDTSDKMVLHGQLGEYFKADEKIVVTRNAYVGMDSRDSITVNGKKLPDTLWLGADTLQSQKVLQKTLKLLNKPTVQKDNEIGVKEQQKKQEREKEKADAKKQMEEEIKKSNPANNVSANKKMSKRERKEAERKVKEDPPKTMDQNLPDSVLLKKQLLVKDSLVKDSVAKLTVVKDTLKVSDKKVVTKKAASKITDASKMVNSKITLPNSLKDTVAITSPADTVRTRIIKAYHNVRVFKSNMQAVADSLFFCAADSALRWYKNPILWGEGSQQTGDTIHVFFKDKKAHSFQILQNGFIVNVETDSTKFNQVKGRKITGFFANGTIKDMYVDGNAESIYYTKNDKGEYDNMNQSVSSRIKFTFAEKELTDISMYREIEGQTNPINKLPKESILTGFIWKPELRPTSKANIIKGKPKKPVSKIVKPSVKADKDKKDTSAKPKKSAVTLKPAKKSVPIKQSADIKSITHKSAVDSLKVDSVIVKP